MSTITIDLKFSKQQEMLLAFADSIRGPVSYEVWLKQLILREARSHVTRFVDGAVLEDRPKATMISEEHRLTLEIEAARRKIAKLEDQRAALPPRLKPVK